MRKQVKRKGVVFLLAILLLTSCSPSDFASLEKQLQYCRENNMTECTDYDYDCHVKCTQAGGTNPRKHIFCWCDFGEYTRDVD